MMIIIIKMFTLPPKYCKVWPLNHPPPWTTHNRTGPGKNYHGAAYQRAASNISLNMPSQRLGVFGHHTMLLFCSEISLTVMTNYCMVLSIFVMTYLWVRFWPTTPQDLLISMIKRNGIRETKLSKVTNLRSIDWLILGGDLFSKGLRAEARKHTRYFTKCLLAYPCLFK